MNVSNEATCPTHDSCIVNIPGFKLLPFDVALHVINFLFGFPTHSYVLWLIVTSTGQGIASEIFTLNMSVCDIMFCLRTLFGAFAESVPTLWNIVMFLSGFVITGRFFQCLICIERYLAVVHPITFLKFKPLRYRLACCAFSWIMISIYCVFSLQLVNPRLFKLFTCMYMSQFLFFLLINLFCCLAVLRALKQSGPGERGREREEINHMKRRAFYIILITTVTLIITYVPGCIASFLFLLSILVPPEVFTLTTVCFMLAGFVQPLLYLHRVQKLPF